MDIAELKRRLISAGRAHPPSDAVPYAFERRVMARLSGVPATDAVTAWVHALWRAAAPCVAIALLLGIWAALVPSSGSSASGLSEDLEQTVFAAVTLDTDSNR
jgi:hypothetical protein